MTTGRARVRAIMVPVRRPGLWHTPRGLRFRVTVAFSLGSLALATLLAAGTFLVARHYLLRQRERALVQQSFVDARAVRDELERRTGVPELLGRLDRVPGSNVVLATQGRWFGTSVALGRENLPDPLVAAVQSGEPVRQRVAVGGRPSLVVGLPLAGVDTLYFQAFPLDELDRTLRTLRNALATGTVLTAILGGVLGLWVSGRVLRPLSQTTAAAERVAGGDLATRLPVTDDPDLAPLARSFNRMVDAVEQRIERERRLTSDVSHELRSPVASLQAAARMIERRAEALPGELVEPFGLLRSQIERLRVLIEDLLELFRADAGTESLDLAPVRLDILVAEAARGHLGGTCRLEVDEVVRRRRVLLDRRRIERVVVNLLDNAAAYAGGATALRVRSLNGMARIEVEDRGPGVPGDERDRIFQRFYRGRAAGTGGDGGSGLGLALVAEQVRLHDGTVWVEDAPGGRGARFVVTLPWREPPGGAGP